MVLGRSFCSSEIFLDLEALDNSRRQNQLPHEILLQRPLFWGPCDQKLRKDDLCYENLSSASSTRVRPNLYLGVYVYCHAYVYVDAVFIADIDIKADVNDVNVEAQDPGSG